jgi:hypothetical protein
LAGSAGSSGSITCQRSSVSKAFAIPKLYPSPAQFC